MLLASHQSLVLVKNSGARRGILRQSGDWVAVAAAEGRVSNVANLNSVWKLGNSPDSHLGSIRLILLHLGLDQIDLLLNLLLPQHQILLLDGLSTPIDSIKLILV